MKLMSVQKFECCYKVPSQGTSVPKLTHSVLDIGQVSVLELMSSAHREKRVDYHVSWILVNLILNNGK